MSDIKKDNTTEAGEKQDSKTMTPKSFKVFAPILSAVLVVACIGTSLSAWSPAVYEAQAMPTVDETADGTDAVSDTETALEGEFFDLDDGVYYGSGTGYAGKISVAVTIASKQITEIEVTEVEADDEAFFNRAKGVIEEIISTQSLDVDVVSGATYSSRGIISAVKNALTGEEDDGETAEVESGQGETSVETVEDAATYNDGTYYGAATGFRGTITVKVVIENGQIVSIEITDSSDDTAYLNKASALISSIISGQSTNVDTVSGATYSSVGIINAVRNALSQAAVSGTSGDTTAQLTVSSVSSGSSTTFTAPAVMAGESGSFPYPDGTYYGTAEGWGGDITVAVTIQNQTITSVSITSAEDETEEYFNQAKVLAQSIVTAQSVDLDVVSGATYSSRGILDAAKAALAAAEAAASNNSGTSETEGSSSDNSGTSANDSSGTDSSDSTNTDSSGNYGSGSTGTAGSGNDQASSELYADGSYTLSVVCNPDEDEDFDSYNLTATVTISGDQIVSITDISGDGDSGNDKYISWAANGRSSYTGVVDQIIALKKGNVTESSVAAVDVVSRATCSSDALKALCQEALRQAAEAFSVNASASAAVSVTSESSVSRTDIGDSDTDADSAAAEAGETDSSHASGTDAGSAVVVTMEALAENKPDIYSIEGSDNEEIPDSNL
ncbi:MAG: FMN-binding protein [Clostridiales bacterium]|nr:FMN-binding protein [Clostridiales bacterium]